MDWKEFFEKEGETVFRLYFYGETSTVSVEELYQMFKQRMQEE